ncbi:hypothetical protein Tco_0417356 [Tanacetum coccineum]
MVEDVENKNSNVSDSDEPVLLNTPLSDKVECSNPEDDIDEIDAFLTMEVSSNIEEGYFDSEGDVIFLENLLSDDTTHNLSPEVTSDHESIHNTSITFSPRSDPLHHEFAGELITLPSRIVREHEDYLNRVENDDSEDEDNELPNLDHQDNPSSPRPPSEPPDVCLDFKPNTAMKNDEDFNQGEIVLSLNVEDVNSFTFVIWTFLPFFTYPEDSPVILSLRNENLDEPKFSEDSRMRQYIAITDHILWDIITNGDQATTDHPSSQFSCCSRCKNFIVSQKKQDLDGNDASKKMQRIFLKQQFESFAIGSREELDQHRKLYNDSEDIGLDELDTLETKYAGPRTISQKDIIGAQAQDRAANLMRMLWEEIDISMAGGYDNCKDRKVNDRKEKKIVAIEDSNSKALVATDNNEEIDWTKEFDVEPVTFAMMTLTELEEDDWSIEIDAEHVHFGQDGLSDFD